MMAHWISVVIATVRPSWRPAEAELRESIAIGYDAGVARPWAKIVMCVGGFLLL